MTSVHSIESECVVLDAQQRATVEACDAGLYARLDRDYGGFAGCALMAVHSFNSDWSQWECHPKGDEIVLLQSGAVTFVLRLPGGDKQVHLETPGQYAIVPRGVWHTARSHGCSVLFVTPGEGTMHSADPEVEPA